MGGKGGNGYLQGSREELELTFPDPGAEPLVLQELDHLADHRFLATMLPSDHAIPVIDAMGSGKAVEPIECLLDIARIQRGGGLGHGVRVTDAMEVREVREVGSVSLYTLCLDIHLNSHMCAGLKHTSPPLLTSIRKGYHGGGP